MNSEELARGASEAEIEVAGQRVFTRFWEATGARECVLCLHGVESHGAWFGEIARMLATRGYNVHAYDRPGWGASPGERGDLAGYAQAVRLAAAVATRLRADHRRLHLVGLSWGGMFALYLALRRGLLFDSVTLIAPGVIARLDPGTWQRARAAGSIILGRGKARIPLPIAAEHFCADRSCQEFIAGDPLRVRSVTARFCVETLKMRRFIAGHVRRRQLPPVQLLLAGEDRIIDNHATRELLHRRMDEVTVFPGSRHSLVLERPNETAAAIVRLARRGRAAHERRRVVVMGAGAVGSCVGGLLALAGHRVSLVCRPAHADAVNGDGLLLEQDGGRRVVGDNLRAVTDPRDVGAPAQLVLLAVKSYDTAAALEQLRALVGPRTVLLSLQNGVDNEPAIGRFFPDNPVIAVAVCGYFSLSSPGRVLWTDDRGGLAGASYRGEAEAVRHCWQDTLGRTGMETLYCDDLEGAGEPWQRLKWSKLMLNAAFNVLSAATGLGTGRILADARHGALAVGAMREGFAIMRRLRIGPVNLPGYPVRHLERLCRLPSGLVRRVLARTTAGRPGGASSTSQDLARGRARTEVDAINGLLARRGRELRLRTPANDELCRLLAREQAVTGPNPQE